MTFFAHPVCRYRAERAALDHDNATLIRVNRFHPQLHARHPHGRAFSLPVFADEFADALDAARQRAIAAAAATTAAAPTK